MTEAIERDRRGELKLQVSRPDVGVTTALNVPSALKLATLPRLLVAPRSTTYNFPSSPQVRPVGKSILPEPAAMKVVDAGAADVAAATLTTLLTAELLT